MVRQRISTLQWFLSLNCLVALLAPATARADIHTDLQIRYRLDDAAMTSTATDSSTQSGRDGTLSGTVDGSATFVPTGGRIGGAVSFDGTDDYISVPAIAPTNNAGELTVAFWVNFDDRDDFDALCSKFEDNFNYFGIQLGGASSINNGNDDLLVTSSITR